MMIRSFRLRLAVISALVSGVVLIAFGGGSLMILARQRIETLDAELQHFGYRIAARSGPNVEGERTEANMLEIFGIEKAPYRFFSLLGQADDELRHQTASWPGGFDPRVFPAGDEPLDPQPVVPESKRPPGGRDRPEGRPNRTPRPRMILEPRYSTVTHDGHRYRVGVFANPEVRIVLGADLDHFAADVRALRNALLIALPGALVLIALGAAFVSRRALRPVELLSERMEQLSTEGLDQRLEPGRTDREFRRIIDAYNSMSERLERSFQQATRFSGDASHELKTPLAVMQGTLEQALGRCPENSEEQRVYSSLLDEVRSQRSVLEGLLLLARADAGKLQLSTENIDFSALLETLVEDAGMLAESRGITVEAELDPGVTVEADPVLLQQALHNLFSNAVKYNHAGGVVACALSVEGTSCRFRVSNTGASIPAGDRQKVFERFFRAEATNAGAPAGAGLGLSLTREIVLAHGGDIRVVESEEDRTTFELVLSTKECEL